jgi:prepilin-type N-terminal cleavage/methylation domain-containing protein
MKNEKGFSLLEVLTALVLMSGAVFLSMRSMESVSSGQSQVRNYAKAHNVGITLMEQLLSVYSNDVKMTAGTHTLTYDRDGNITLVRPTFTATWIIKLDTPLTKLISIALQVTWLENGHPHTVSFQTFRMS